MKSTTLVLALGLITSGLVAHADPSPAQAACQALGGGMMLNFDCKAFDGSPITGVRVCVDGDTAVLLITNTQNQVFQETETNSQSTASTFIYVASEYSLEVPLHSAPNAQFDAILKLPASANRAQTAPLVCTSAN